VSFPSPAHAPLSPSLPVRLLQGLHHPREPGAPRPALSIESQRQWGYWRGAERGETDDLSLLRLFGIGIGTEKAFCCLNCSGFVPVQDKNRHLQVCPAALKVTCKVCGLALPTSELDDHEISHQIAQFSTLPRKKPQSASISAPRPVPEAIKRCQFCYLRFPASEIRNHKANCPKSYFCPNCQRPQRYSTFELHARICKQPNGSFQGDQWTCGVCRQGMNSQCKG